MKCKDCKMNVIPFHDWLIGSVTRGNIWLCCSFCYNLRELIKYHCWQAKREIEFMEWVAHKKNQKKVK